MWGTEIEWGTSAEEINLLMGNINTVYKNTKGLLDARFRSKRRKNNKLRDYTVS
jgi:hypothetical protein